VKVNELVTLLSTLKPEIEVLIGNPDCLLASKDSVILLPYDEQNELGEKDFAIWLNPSDHEKSHGECIKTINKLNEI
jgi:hypothetical protein